MRPAIRLATMAAIATTARAAAVVLNMDESSMQPVGRISAADDFQLVITKPHTPTHLMVVFTGLGSGCIISRGCSCYRWDSTVHLIRFPPMLPGQQLCHNVTTVLKAREFVVEAAALLPRAEIPILWHILRNRECRRYSESTSISQAVVESMVAASTLREQVCVVAGTSVEAVVRPRDQTSAISEDMMLTVMGIVCSGLLITAIHVRASV